jgi:predicted HicB family RNase H-like nuclease
MTMADHFTYRVSWSGEDGEHVGTCLEFPSLSHLADDPETALRGVRKLVTDVVADLLANNEPIPQPLADTRFSGKFLTRVPPELHRQLALEAAQDQISLNRLVNKRLSVSPSQLPESSVSPSQLPELIGQVYEMLTGIRSGMRKAAAAPKLPDELIAQLFKLTGAQSGMRKAAAAPKRTRSRKGVSAKA